MLKISIIYCCSYFLLNSLVYAKGSVEVGLDSIAIRFDAIPLNNLSDYKIVNKTVFLDDSKLIEKKESDSLSLKQVSNLSNSSLDTIKIIKTFSLQGIINFNLEQENRISYIAPNSTKDKVVIDGQIFVWGKDQFTGNEKYCSVSVKKSVVQYVIVKSIIESFGPGELLVVFVDPETGECAGAEIS